jgi:histidyl-tRNA synthetase
MRLQSPRGTQDVLPADAFKWHHVESTFREIVGRYGYLDIRTPTFEDTELFTRSAGETSDIVTKEMYEFRDKGDRSITLKPEGTAGIIRAVIQYSLCPPGVIGRFSYVTPIFRYERPQKGRLREAHQVGLELVGSASPRADAEVIEITYRFYEALGLTGVRVELNSIGRGDCRARFREALLAKASSLLVEMGEEFRERVEKNPLRLLDSKDPSVREVIDGLPPITEFLEADSCSKFEELQSLLTESQIPFVLKPGIVRGLDYYTDTVFEVISSNLGAQDALCGGGRYDGLVKELGGKDTQSVGVAMGIERAIIVLEEQGLFPSVPGVDVFLLGIAGAVHTVAAPLRNAGISVLTDPDSRSMKSQLGQADRAGARFAVIAGEEEWARNAVQVRDLGSSTQTEVAIDRLVAYLKAVL